MSTANRPLQCIIRLIAVLLTLFAPLAAVAQAAAPQDMAASPIGLWETIDDKTGKPTAVVEIFEREQKLFGRIEQIHTGCLRR